ncbi:MAG: flagellar export chaperone FliS [Acidobacteriota bacterium]
MNSRLDRYFEAEVLHADPLKLVALLCRGALDAVASAQVALEAKDIPARSRQILKAWEIVEELRRSLNHEQGGNISRQLADLYAYVGQRLLDANKEQSGQPLTEAAIVLTTLAEAWQEIQQQTQPVLDDYVPLTVAC